MRLSTLFALSAFLALPLLLGCGTDSRQPFFKPEISGAVYAARGVVDPIGDPTADDTRAINRTIKLQLNNYCEYTVFGWTCTNDSFSDDGFLMTLDDQAGGYYCAPRFRPITTTSPGIVPAPSASQP